MILGFLVGLFSLDEAGNVPNLSVSNCCWSRKILLETVWRAKFSDEVSLNNLLLSHQAIITFASFYIRHFCSFFGHVTFWELLLLLLLELLLKPTCLLKHNHMPNFAPLIEFRTHEKCLNMIAVEYCSSHQKH